MKKPYKILIIFLAALCAVFGIVSANLLIHGANIKAFAAKTVFVSLRSIEERLDNTLLSKEYTVRDSETLLRALYELETAVTAAEKLYSNPIDVGYHSLFDLADALGSSYSALHNDVAVESILYDGELDENELEFITELAVDVYYLLLPMYGEDGMNIKDNLKYGEVRQPLGNFIKKWGFWAWSSDAPYELLDRE